jgi:hypothetical protein
MAVHGAVQVNQASRIWARNCYPVHFVAVFARNSALEVIQRRHAESAKLLPAATTQSAKYALQLLKLLSRFAELAFSSQAFVLIEVLACFGD